MTALLPLEGCGEAPLSQVGGKARGLGWLIDEGLAVPAGVCVPTDVFVDHLGHDAVAALRRAALEPGRPAADRADALAALRDVIQRTPLDRAIGEAIDRAVEALRGGDGGVRHRVAVRSSATAEDLEDRSFAGLHDTVLGATSGDEVRAALTRCWASLYSDRAVAYRERHGVGDAAMAVVLQRQLPAERAGVLFSVDPVTGRDDRVVIEACEGLGEGLVSGRITPERLVLARPAMTIVERTPTSPGAAALLGDDEAAALGRIAARLEPRWGGAVDVEWAIADGTITVLQARRVTAVAGPPEPGAAGRGGAPGHGSGDAAAGEDDAWAERQVWTNVNAGEVAPDVVTPMTWCVVEPVATRLLGVFFELAGVEVAGHRLLGLVGGRVYFNLNTMLGLLRRLPGMKGKGVLQLFGGEEEAPPELGDLEIPDEDIPEARHSVLGMLWRLPKLAWDLLRFPRGGGARAAARTRRHADELAALEPAELDDATLRATIADTVGQLATDGPSFRAMGLATMLPTALTPLCTRWFGDEGAAVASQLMAGLGDTESADAGLELWRLARQAAADGALAAAIAAPGDAETLLTRLPALDGGPEFADGWQRFLEQHGHHARGELELSNPRWRERPDELLEQLRSCLDGMAHRDLLAHHAAVARRRRETEETCRRQLRNPLKRALFELVRHAAQRSAPYRETLKSQMVRKLGALRRMLLELGAREVARGVLAEADDVFYLRLDELADPVAAAAEVAARRAERVRFQALTPPPVLRGRFDPALHRQAEPPPLDDGVLRGIAVHPGVVVGRARVILRAGEDRVRPGEILVAPFTDPGWTPYFLNAAAIVTDLGGVLSHGSIIARELGIPAVVNVDRATQRIETGQQIEVDGDRGTVRVL